MTTAVPRRAVTALIGISFAISAAASALAMRWDGAPFPPWVLLAWYATIFAHLATARPATQPPRWHRWIADAVAVGLAIHAATLLQTVRGGWSEALAVLLVGLQAARAPLVTTPRSAEFCLLGGLVLALFATASMAWSDGVLVLAAFLWPTLSALSLAAILVEIERVAGAGSPAEVPVRVRATLLTGTRASLPVAVLALALFILVQDRFDRPLLRLPIHGAGGRQVLYVPAWQTAAVVPRGGVAMRGGGEELFRVRAPRWLSRFRLRVYDSYGPDGWREGKESETAIPPGERLDLAQVWGPVTGHPGHPYAFEVQVLAAGTESYLTAGVPQRLDDPDGRGAGVVLGMLGTVRPGTRELIPAGRRYAVQGVEPAWDEAELAAAGDPPVVMFGNELDWSAAPVHVARFATAACGATGGPWGRAVCAARQLRSACAYRWAPTPPPAGGVTDPVERFLFESREGNCLDFASAFALAARGLDVPTRLVTGFLAHRYDESDGAWTVTEADGHAWCEVFIEGTGWVPLDPTPPTAVAGVPAGGPPDPRPFAAPVSTVVKAGRRPVLRQAKESLARRVAPWLETARLMRAARRVLLVVCPLLLVGALAARAWRWWKERSRAGLPQAVWPLLERGPESVRWFLRACAAAGRRGVHWEEALTALEHAGVVTETFPGAGTPLLALAGDYNRALFGVPRAEAVTAAREQGAAALAAIRTGPRVARRSPVAAPSAPVPLPRVSEPEAVPLLPQPPSPGSAAVSAPAPAAATVLRTPGILASVVAAVQVVAWSLLRVALGARAISYSVSAKMRGATTGVYTIDTSLDFMWLASGLLAAVLMAAGAVLFRRRLARWVPARRLVVGSLGGWGVGFVAAMSLSWGLNLDPTVFDTPDQSWSTVRLNWTPADFLIVTAMALTSAGFAYFGRRRCGGPPGRSTR